HARLHRTIAMQPRKESTMPAIQPEDVKPQLRGALAFPITPFNADNSVDIEAVKANAELLATSRVAAIVAPSGTGEFFSLTPDEVNAVLEATVEAVGGRKPVVAAAGVGPKLAAEQAAHAESVGAAAVMVVPPYYAVPDPD